MKLPCDSAPCVPSAYIALINGGGAPGFRFVELENKAKAVDPDAT